MVQNLTAVFLGCRTELDVNIAYRLLNVINPDVNLSFILLPETKEDGQEMRKLINEYNGKLEKPRNIDTDIITINLSDMHNVYEVSRQLNKKCDVINYFFINVTSGYLDSIDWPRLLKGLATKGFKVFNDPSIHAQKVGMTSKDGMGFVFQTSVFAPYYLMKKLLGPLSKENGIVVWVSSLKADEIYVPVDDLELYETNTPTDDSGRLIDLLHLASYRDLKIRGVYQYFVHPGVFINQPISNKIGVIFYYLLFLIFYLSRFLGSYWHTINPYKAANSAIYVTLFKDRNFERQDLKYGSATYNDGYEHVIPEEVDDVEKYDVYNYIKKKEDIWDRKLGLVGKK